MHALRAIAMAAAVSLCWSSVGIAAPAAVESPVAEDSGVAEGDPPASDASEVEAAAAEPGAEDPVHDPVFVARVREATQHYGEGKALAKAGQYAAAAAEFERSFALIEFGNTLQKIVQAYDDAGQPIEALQNGRAYLELPPCEGGRERPGIHPCTEPDKIREITDQVARLRRLVAEIRIQLGEDVVLREIRVAGRIVPQSQFPLLVLPGSFPVEITGAGKGEQRRIDVEVKAGEPYVLYIAPFQSKRVDPPVIETPGGEEQPTIDYARRKRIQKGFFWGGVGLTAASGVATVVLGVLTRRSQQRFDDNLCAGLTVAECEENSPIDPASNTRYPLSHRQRYEALLPATNAMIGVTAFFAVSTVVLGIFAFSKKPAGANARVQVRGRGLSVRF